MTETTGMARSLYESFGRGDLDAVLSAMSADVDIIYYGQVPWAGQWKGIEGATKFFGAVGVLDFEAFEPQEYFSAGDSVTIIGRTAATVRGTGARFDNQWAHIMTFKNGKLVRFIGYDTARTG